MTVFAAFATLDATRIADRLTDTEDAGRWARPVPTATRPEVVATGTGYSWWSLARNPHALLLTGMVGAGLVREAVRGALA